MDSYTMNTSNQYIKYHISVYENSTNVDRNISNVTVHVFAWRSNTGYTTYGTGTVYCNINGTSYSASISPDQKITSEGIVLFTKTLDIPHNDDGTKVLSVSARIDHSQFNSNEQGANFSLSNIARASTPTLSSNSVNFGETLTVYTNRVSTAFTHHLYYSFNGGPETGICADITDSADWSIPKELMNEIPGSTTATVVFRLYTFNGSTNIGSKTVSCTVKVPSDVVPTVDIAITEAVEDVANKVGLFVKGLSKLSLVLNESGVYGSTVASRSISANGLSYNTSEVITNELTTEGNMTIKASVTDSRGRVGSCTKTIKVYDYSKPMIIEANCFRANSDGTESDEGTYLKTSYNTAITSINGVNEATYTLSYKKTVETAYNDYTIASESKDTIKGTKLLPNFDVNYSYDIILKVEDLFYSTEKKYHLGTAFTLMDFNASGHGIAIGKVSEKNSLECALDAEFKSVRTQQGADLDKIRSHIGMIVQSTTLDTEEKVKDIYGGKSWNKIEGLFLLGASDKYPVNSTGGREEVTLSANIGACNNTPASLGYITETSSKYQETNSPGYLLTGMSLGTYSSWNHSTPVTERESSDRNTNIMPPYKAVYIWERTK